MAASRAKWLWLIPPLGVLAIMICDSSPPPSAPPPPSSPLPPQPATGRAGVVAAALSQVGASDPAKYWASAAPGVAVQRGIDWCGGFVLWALHQAGLALDRQWKFGLGFILVGPKPLAFTKDPKLGDVAYFDKNQHHAVISAVNGDAVELVNGNGTAGKVSTSVISKAAHLSNQKNAFFSIQRLLNEVAPNA